MTRFRVTWLVPEFVMRAVFGLLLVMLGLALAVIWMPEQQGERQLAVVTEIATKGFALKGDRSPSSDDRSGRTFSPHTPLLATVEAPGARTAYTVAVARVGQPEVPPLRLLPVPVAITVATSSSDLDPTVVTAPIGRPGVSSQTRSVVGPEMGRDELVRNIQRELKRVGCYAGDVDGDWGPGSRRAMVNFTDRVNASLPVDHPDFILLTLLRGHSGAACGKGCPAGHSAVENGRCLPNVVQARRTVEPRVAAVRPSVANEQPAPVTNSNWSTNVVTAAPLRSSETAPSGQPSLVGGTSGGGTIGGGTGVGLAAAGAAAAALSTSAQPPAPSWRMAVGGPRNGGGSAYVTNPPEPTPARDAVRTEAETPAARPAQRERSRRAAASGRRSGPSSAQYGYRYAPPVAVYRPARPRFYAAAPARRSSRSWTGAFFGTH